MKKNIFYWLIFSSFIAQAMELPLEKENSKQTHEVPKLATKKSKQKKEATKQKPSELTFSYAGKSHTLSLSDAHIFTYQIQTDLATHEEKFIGFHHYGPNVPVRKLEKGQVIEINSNFWIYIPEGMDINTFHMGYPLYKGTWYPKKTFFPSRWKREGVINFIKKQVEEAQANNSLIVEQEGKITQEDKQTYRCYCPLNDGTTALKFIIKCYPPSRHVLISVFPIDAGELPSQIRQQKSTKEPADSLHTIIKKTTLSSKKSTLNSLAVEQLRKIQENARLKIQKPELIKAIQTGNHHEVHALLKNDADPNVRDQQGCTPLMIAAQKGDYEIMRDLIDYGALIFENEAYIKDKKGVTVLDYALRSWNEFAVLPLLKQADPNDIELIKIYTKALVTAIDKISSEPVEKLSAEVIHLLLSYGADPTLPDDNGYTPLMHITQLNNLKADALKVAQYIVTLLLERGAKIDAVNEKGRIKNYTALMYAAQSGYTPLVRQLLEAGADYEMLNDQGKNAAVIAENKGQKVTAAAINAYKKEKENWKKNNNATDLIYWAFKNNLPQMKKALTLNPLKINYISENGESALSYAAKNNNYEAVNFFLSNGADPCNRYDQNAGNLDNFISLHTYIQKNSAIAPEIKQLIADYYEQFKRGESAKKLVQEQQKQRIIDQFKQEVDRNELTKETVQELKKLGTITIDGTSALIYAIKRLATKAVKLLCSYKILEGPDPLACAYDLVCAKETNVQATNLFEILIHSQAGTPENMQRLFERLMQDERFDILDLIKDIPHFWFALLLDAVVQRKPNRIDEICKRHVFITNEQAATCVFKAIEFGSLDCIKLLLHYYPSSKNQQNSKGLSALHYAAQTEQYEIFAYLCKEVDVTLQDTLGRSAGNLIARNKPHTKSMQNAFNAALKQKKQDEENTKKMREYEQLKDLPAGLAAVMSNNEDAIKKLSPGEVVWKNDTQQTLLMIAIIEEKKQIVDTLLGRSELDIDAQDTKGWTALWYAIKAQNADIVKRLIAKRAQIMVCDKLGKTSFDIPCNNKIKNILREACIEKMDDSFMKKISAEFISKLGFVSSQKEKLAAHLCKKAEIGILNDLIASDQGFLALVKKAVASLRLETVDFAGAFLESPQSAEKHSKAFLKEIARLDPMADKAFIQFILKNKILSEDEALSFAIAADNKESVEYLVSHYEKQSWPARLESSKVMNRLYATDRDLLKGMTSICFASTLNRKDILKILLQKPHGDINRTIGSFDRVLPFWVVLLHVYQGYAEIVNLLAKQKLELGSAQGASEQNDVSFFELLLAKKYYFVAKFLLEHESLGRRITSKKIAGKKAEIIAIQILEEFDDKNIPIILELIKLRPGTLQPLCIAQHAARFQEVELFKALYQSKNIVFSPEEKIALLNLALPSDDDTISPIIIGDPTIDINQFYENETPLMAAVQCNANINHIEKLLKKPGIDIHKANNEGLTAVHLARSTKVIDLIRNYDTSPYGFSKKEVAGLIAKGQELLELNKFNEAQRMYNCAYYKASYKANPENNTDPSAKWAAYWQAHAATCLADLGIKADENLFGDNEIMEYIASAKELLKFASAEESVRSSVENLLKVIDEHEKILASLGSKEAPVLKQEKISVAEKPVNNTIQAKPRLKIDPLMQENTMPNYNALHAFTRGMMHIDGGTDCPANFEEARACFQVVLKEGDEELKAGAWGALGWIYSVGDAHLQKDEKKAVTCFKKAADHSTENEAQYQASYRLGKLLVDGITKDHTKAYHYLLKVEGSKKFSHFRAAAQFKLGALYSASQDVSDLTKAKHYLEAAANQEEDKESKQLALLALLELEEKLKKSNTGQAELIAVLAQHLWVKGNYEQAQKNFETLYNSTSDQTIKDIAGLYLGAMYMQGQGCPVDYHKALNYFLQILKLNADGKKKVEDSELLEKSKQASVVKLLQQGESYWAARNYEKTPLIFQAIYRLSDIVEKKALAAAYLGRIYKQGHHCQVNLVEAMSFFQETATISQDNRLRAAAWLEIARIYELQKDEKNAIVYFSKAADQVENKEARYESCLILGMKIKDGKGMERNRERAIYYLNEVEKSTDFSYFRSTAQIWLGFLYAEQNVPEDLEKTKNYWLEASKQNEDQESKQLALQALKFFEVANFNIQEIYTHATRGTR